MLTRWPNASLDGDLASWIAPLVDLHLAYVVHQALKQRLILVLKPLDAVSNKATAALNSAHFLLDLFHASTQTPCLSAFAEVLHRLQHNVIVALLFVF